ncbi:MAG TPA: deoxyguanosinetriphosphate triphosphohydrolase [Candidatus Limnocylindria bacterium]|jgi:dGTPase|nr:deoxyguanosinetriphosphate triphosphohydrolase [Candidatus Limnocylindria bacterium]
MPVNRNELEKREAQFLAPYAQLSGATRGRAHEEEPPTWRTHFQRDRDRVIHSRAFRRLEYKTQVFLNGTGDHLRTRLTHTMEVAAISRNIARALQLNEDLTETIALAHDLGHSPFGHKGEYMLNRLMKDHGGFEHNRQSLRVVEVLEQKYPKFSGLNLSWEVREGLAKHHADFDGSEEKQKGAFKHPSLEAQIANLADEITYYSHDLDDGLDSGLLDEKKLLKDVKVWAQAARKIKKQFGALPPESRRYYTIRQIIDEQVTDVVLTTEKAVLDTGVQSADEVRRCRSLLVQYSPDRKQENIELRRYLYRNLYYHPAVAEPNNRAIRMLGEVFAYYLAHPEAMGRESSKTGKSADVYRVICDCVASMTDRYLIQEHRRLFGLDIPSLI